jgi:hypothetical protein
MITDPKKKGTAPRGPLPTPFGNYPLVTTGGGALPLPTYCAQPAMLRRANIAAVASASFFMEQLSFVMTNRTNRQFR